MPSANRDLRSERKTKIARSKNLDTFGGRQSGPELNAILIAALISIDCTKVSPTIGLPNTAITVTGHGKEI